MEYIAHLSRDKNLKKIIDRQQPLKLVKRKKIHLDLCGSIMSQQLSTRVAEIIQKRFLGLYGESPPSPEQILETPVDLLRSIGLSHAKTRYIHNVARFAIDAGIDHKHLKDKDNEQVIEYLTQIKGVGRWTAEMLLIFTLGREDVFAAGDLGIQQAMARLYKLDITDKKLLKQEIIQISEKWSPYRTYACLHLWRWKDNNPLK